MTGAAGVTAVTRRRIRSSARSRDIEALIEEAGGSIFLFGISSGGALILEAANRLSGVEGLAVYEPPFVVDPSGNVMPEDFLGLLKEFVASDRRTAAVKLFMKHVGAPAFVTTVTLLLPRWRKLKGVAHTLPYDITILGDTGSGKPLPASSWRSITAPTLVLHGGKSPVWMGTGARSLADVLPNAQHRTLEGQTHMVKPQVLAPALVEFFAGPGESQGASAVSKIAG